MHLFTNLRRRHDPRVRQVSEQQWEWLLKSHPILNGLSGEELEQLQELTMLFLRRKTFEAAEGMVLSDDMQSVIAIQASLPLLHLGFEWYENWNTVVVVPRNFVRERQELDRAGVLHKWEEVDSGESWAKGPVVLSWEDVEVSGRGDGHNVVIHEAAHRLDMLDGAINGRPALHKGMSPGQWVEVFSRAYQDFKTRLMRAERQGINSYAATNDAEFFAVMSEYFFERPYPLIREYPEVYRLFVEFYRQDPYRRLKP